jgi:hypothetical protein
MYEINLLIKFVTIPCENNYEDFFPIACNPFNFFNFHFS